MKEAKDKAEELIEKLSQNIGLNCKTSTEQCRYEAIQCALICVDYIITSNPHSNPFNTSVTSTMDFWNKVKQEILNRQ